ncbi:hypothetical protein DRJ22_00435 [Candidatus Woesearchaeota archaeon]|nr:MAG: hypothetical protein B6U93_00330 [Candidatus Woesearchaeota archaeon ex4484_78]RLE47022.1 MAG: hypothetical protein DRJ22_00435 [Candidatus Woesearchaeota archaeon]
MAPRLFFDGKLKEIVDLDKEESRHVNVLRLKKEDKVELFDGKGNIFKGKIESLGKTVKVKIIENTQEKKEKPTIELWTATPKGERSDWLTEKATEVGVDKIVPVIFKRSITIPKKNKIERWKRIAKTASAQSKRAFIPEISEPIELKKALQKTKGQIIVCTKQGKNITQIKTEKEKIILLVGPEGGFSEEELQLLKEKEKLSLGKNTLRTETAGVIGASVVKLYLNNTANFKNQI